MSASPLNFELLFNKSAKKEPVNRSILKKATLLYEFDLEKDFPEFNKSDIGLLQSEAIAKDNGKYILDDDVRNNVIQEDIGINNLTKEIEKNNIESDFSKVILKLLNSKLNYPNCSDVELFYLSKLAPVFQERLKSIDIINELQSRYYFASFKKIAENFAGREKELSQINEYVDWLPKENIYRRSVGFFRNVFNWHDKPPLLIQGIGGIGKSTLISKFILDHSQLKKESKPLPFVYIDFDLPGFSLAEPLTLLIESFRQLSIQFAEHKKLFNEISAHVAEMIYSGSDDYSGHQLTESSREIVYNSVDGIIKKYGSGLDKIDNPILIVFDSFEEMQYRASRHELNSLFNFINEISGKIPRVRTVFIGRSEISDSVGEFKFDKIELKDFDMKSAFALLGKFGVTNKETTAAIYKGFGGNPLLLLLAADLVKKEPGAIKDFAKISERKGEYLVNRILDHIHNADVRKIAVPGMLVRAVTPDVVKYILAEPCGLGDIDDEQAKYIFKELKKEVALITRTADDFVIVFRQDVRIACESMVLEKYPEASRKIKNNAIQFYETIMSEKRPELEAEYYYHVLKSGEIPKSFDRTTYHRLRNYLESSSIEFPENVRFYISSLLGSHIKENIIESSDIKEWENHYLPQLKSGLNGDLEFLKKLHRDLKKRKDREIEPDSLFPAFEALLYQRLNMLDESDKVIERAFSQLGKFKTNYEMFYNLFFIRIQNLEYSKNYEHALELARLLITKFEDPNNYLTYKTVFILRRLERRCNVEPLKLESHSSHMYDIDGFFDTHWEAIYKIEKPVGFATADNFEQLVDVLKKEAYDLKTLEPLCMELLNVFLKDITLTGEFEIVLRDFLYIVEARGFDKLSKSKENA